MKKFLFLSLFTCFAIACGNSNSEVTKTSPTAADQSAPADGNPSYDQQRGEGKFSKVDVSTTLDVSRAEAGSKVYAVKCSACHKLTGGKISGSRMAGRHGQAHAGMDHEFRHQSRRHDQ